MSAALEQQEQTVEGDGIEKTGIEVPADGTRYTLVVGGEEGELFPGADYESEELALPKIDGEGVDKIAVKVSGRVWLERGSPEHVALVRDVRLGQKVTLVCAATVRMPVPGYSTDKEGDLDVISLTRHFAVTSVSRAAGEEL